MFPALARFLSASSLALTHTSAALVHQPLPHERRVRAVSANKRQSPPFSPATSHHSSPLCDRLARWLSLSLALHQSLKKTKQKSTPCLCSFSGNSGDLQSGDQTTIEAEHYGVVNAIQSRAKTSIAFLQSERRVPEGTSKQNEERGAMTGWVSYRI